MPRQLGSPQIRAAYHFLVAAEREGRVFSFKELQEGSGWAPGNVRVNLSKKLSDFVTKVNGGYKCSGVSTHTEESFCRLCSQNASLARDPHRPSLHPKIEGLVVKAREAALAAVQHYNNPTTVFRSDNYVVLMTIAFTSLFQAIFKRDGVDYTVYEKRTGKAKTVAGGKPMLWDVMHSAKHYEEDSSSPVVENLRFLTKMRHEIEHRALHISEIDVSLCGHCQAMIMNFERILVKEFTSYYSLRTSLTLPLHLSGERPGQTVKAMREIHSKEYEEIKEVVSQFHAGLGDDIVGDPSFCFRVWLIPKSANRAKSSDMSIEFVRLDDCTPQQREQLESAIVALKPYAQLVDIREQYPLGLKALAAELPINEWETRALVWELNLRDDPACCREFRWQSTSTKAFSMQALNILRSEIDRRGDMKDLRKRFSAHEKSRKLSES